MEATVLLLEERAQVVYEPQRVQLPDILRAIEDVGFEAQLQPQVCFWQIGWNAGRSRAVAAAGSFSLGVRAGCHEQRFGLAVRAGHPWKFQPVCIRAAATPRGGLETRCSPGMRKKAGGRPAAKGCLYCAAGASATGVRGFGVQGGADAGAACR